MTRGRLLSPTSATAETTREEEPLAGSGSSVSARVKGTGVRPHGDYSPKGSENEPARSLAETRETTNPGATAGNTARKQELNPRDRTAWRWWKTGATSSLRSFVGTAVRLSPPPLSRPRACGRFRKSTRIVRQWRGLVHAPQSLLLSGLPLTHRLPGRVPRRCNFGPNCPGKRSAGRGWDSLLSG